MARNELELQQLQTRVGARARQEIPPREEIEAKIEAIKEQLRAIANQARSLMLTSFDLAAKPALDEKELQIDENPLTASFFSHDIGGLMIALSVHLYTQTQKGMEHDSTFFDLVQQIVYEKIRRYKSSKFKKMLYEAAAVKPFSQAAFSFRWYQSPTLFEELNTARGDLVTQINYLNGMIPNSRLREIIREEQERLN